MSKDAVSPKVLEFLRNNANLEYGIDEITRETGCKRSSVTGCLLRMAKNSASPIVFGSQQGFYRYSTSLGNKEEPQTPEMYEFIGLTQAGERIIRDEHKRLWRIAGEL